MLLGFHLREQDHTHQLHSCAYGHTHQTMPTMTEHTFFTMSISILASYTPNPKMALLLYLSWQILHSLFHTTTTRLNIQFQTMTNPSTCTLRSCKVNFLFLVYVWVCCQQYGMFPATQKTHQPHQHKMSSAFLHLIRSTIQQHLVHKLVQILDARTF